MKPLFFILRKYLKNSIKNLKKKPLTMIAYLILAVITILMVVLSFIMPSNSLRGGSQEIFGALSSVALLAFTYFGVKQGISSGNSFFRMADVNLVFTAPISPKKILIYGFIQQFIATIFIMLFISFQIPNLKNNFPINRFGVLLIYITVFLLFFVMQLIGMLIYSFASKSNRIRANLEKILNILVFLFLGGFIIILLQKQDLMKAAVLYLNNDFFNYIPFLGWFKTILMAAVDGISFPFFINILFIIASFVVMIYVIYKLKTDYYEDVLAATERKEQLIAAKRAGNAGFKFRNTKLKKAQQKYKGSGAISIFYRHILEFKKSGFFFINKTTFFIVAIGIASKYFFTGITSSIPKEAGPSVLGSGDFTFKIILFSSIYILFFFSMQGKWAQELSKPFIYLIPSSSASKVFYATLAETFKNGIDGLILFIVAGFMFKANIQTILMSAIAYMTFSVIYTYGDVLSRRMFGGVHSKNLIIFFKMFLIIFIIAPEIIISLIFNLFIFKGTALADYSFYGTIIGYNLIATFVILLLCKGIFEQLEMN
jgi:hypothetical protein